MRFVLPKQMVKMSLAPAYADPRALTDERLDRYFDLLRAPGARGALIARMEQSIRFDPVDRLRAIQAPTLLIWGEQDRLIPFSNAADYVKAIPNAELVALPGVGHLPQEESPAVSLAALTGFLDR
jgi:pimeloyl-ACP methyl ester carboxylesterase